MSVTQVNPFTLVYDALITLLLSHPTIPSLVATKNLIVYNSATDRAPLKQDIQSADLPEIVLATNGILDATMQASSSMSRVVRNYSWMISTGDTRLPVYLYPIEWAVFCAMTGWQTRITILQWPLNSGQHFVKGARITSVDEGESRPELNRGIKGWSSIWNCSIEMWFRTADLTAELET